MIDAAPATERKGQLHMDPLALGFVIGFAVVVLMSALVVIRQMGKTPISCLTIRLITA